MSDQDHKPNYFAIIPANVRYCKDIEPGAKLLYGEITALSNREGYCWATNKYLADLYDVDERTIRRWLESLKEQEFIFVSLDKSGFQTSRKIYIIQENFTTGQKGPVGGTRTAVRQDTNALHNNTQNITSNKQQQQEDEVVVYGCVRETAGLTIEDQIAISKYPENRVCLALKFAKIQKPTTTLIQLLKWHCSQKVPPIADASKVKDDPKENKKYCKKILSEMFNHSLMSKYFDMNILSTYVEFTPKTTGQPICLSYDECGFKLKLNELIEKYSK